MTAVNPDCYHQSASAVKAFKACPTRYRLAYREGLRAAKDTDTQRMGTNWHAMHEVYANVGRECFENDELQLSAEDCAEAALAAVVTHLNESYTDRPSWKTHDEWALEQQILLTSFVGYLGYYSEDPVQVLASEVAFDLPIHNPRLGLPLPMSQVKRVGKIDHLIKWNGMIGVLERKSTSRSIDDASDYWRRSAKDTQVSNYALALQDMRVQGYLGGGTSEREEIAFADPLRPGMMEVIDLGPKGEVRFGNTLYDVWHKPTTKPKDLSQKDTAEFIATGNYFSQAFTVEHGGDAAAPSVTVNGTVADVEIGKKGFAIKETVEMYAARLMADIYERPEFYFKRREIARTDAQLRSFRKELFNIYQAMKTYGKGGHWFENEDQCDATFPCSYIPICYGPGADAVCDGKTTPDGFKRIFVDLTVKGEILED